MSSKPEATKPIAYGYRMDTTNLLVLNAWAIIPLVLVGSLLHFAYDWSGHNKVVAVFAAVNESYWEHIKIAFWPVLLWLVGLFALGGWQILGFIPAMTAALYSVPVSMVAMVFGYKSITGKNLLWLDIAVFAITVGLALMIFALVATELAASIRSIGISVLLLLPLGVAFIRYTYAPPNEPDLFVDPLNQRYGLDAHPEDN